MKDKFFSWETKNRIITILVGGALLEMFEEDTTEKILKEILINEHLYQKLENKIDIGTHTFSCIISVLAENEMFVNEYKTLNNFQK